MNRVEISKKYNIYAEVIPVGNDICVIVSGGDSPHIGALSAAVSGTGVGAAKVMHEGSCGTAVYDNNAGPGIRMSIGQTATLALPSHKEDQICAELAKKLSEELGKNTAVLCGIHIDNIPRESIGEIVDLIDNADKIIADKIRESAY